jgi:hypothetical protein
MEKIQDGEIVRFKVKDKININLQDDSNGGKDEVPKESFCVQCISPV